ncbi:hypothetical protein [Pelomicrobium sp.]|uniref:hypothetical protein n=1 Tax=unclassified Pelomicrobium TaxID=2815318 RepID=UPI002FDD7FB2
MDCADEVQALQAAVGPVVGGADRLAFDVINWRMTVAESASQVPDRVILEAVARTGMRAERLSPGAPPAGFDTRRHSAQAWLTALSGIATAAGFVLDILWAGGLHEALRLPGGHEANATPLPVMAAYALAILLGGRYVIVKAWHAARQLRPDMNLLMTIAVAGGRVAAGGRQRAVAPVGNRCAHNRVLDQPTCSSRSGARKLLIA